MKSRNSKKEEASLKEIPQNNKKKRKANIIIIILIALTVMSLGLIIAGVIYVKQVFDYRYNEITSEPEELGFSEVKDDNIVNIALFGIDSRKDDFSGRSDSIMILSINTTDDKIKLVSVLRDSFVPIEREEYTEFSKINSAYAKGGPELAIKTLNNAFSLDISEYATVNFVGMAEIIDSMGGVEIELTAAEVREVNSMTEATYKDRGITEAAPKISGSGINTLNGIQAVSYSRIRYLVNAEGTSNDYGRSDRQRYVLSQLFKKVTSLQKTEYISLIKALMPYCETSLSYGEILNLAVDVLMGKPVLEESRIPDTSYTMTAPQTEAGAIVYYDLNFAANLIHAFFYEDIKPESFIEELGIEQKDWYSEGYILPEIITYKERKEKNKEAVQEQTTQIADSSDMN